MKIDHKYYPIYVSCMYNFNTFNTVHSLQVATLVHSCLYTIILNDPQEKSSVSMLITLHDTSVLSLFSRLFSTYFYLLLQTTLEIHNWSLHRAVKKQLCRIFNVPLFAKKTTFLEFILYIEKEKKR